MSKSVHGERHARLVVVHWREHAAGKRRLADDEIIRVDDTYYYTASNMHYSPGAPILRSYDLVNWEYAGHALPVLDFSAPA